MKINNIQIETAIIHIANSFLSQGMNISCYKDTLDKDGDSDNTKTLKAILRDIAKKSRLFNKQIKSNVDIAIDIFNKLEDSIRYEIKNPTPQGRFKKVCRLNDGDLEANAVLLCVSLIREHRCLENRKIHLQYKLADDVIASLVDNKTKGYENARILSKRYVQELLKMK